MQMKFGADDILGHRVLRDGSGVGVMFKSGEDEIELLVPTQNIHGLFSILGDILTALDNVSNPKEGQRVNARFPTTANVTISKETQPPSVVVVYDANRPTQTALAIGTAAARKMGRELITKAREAEAVASQTPPTMTAQDEAPKQP